jgi:hypothetical protein
MTALTQQHDATAAGNSPLRLIVKGAASFGLFAIMLVGAVYHLLGVNFPEDHQVVAALGGAVTGAVCAALIRRRTSNH